MKKRLALFGGSKVRKTKMPPRYAFGKSEEKYLKKAIQYYRMRGEDPPYQGKFEEIFCKKFNNFMGQKKGYSDAVSSGCAAIYVSLAALNLPKNSEVLISPVTCSSDLSVVILQGHKPVLVDSEKNSYNVNLEEIKKKITNKTKAAILTHAAGEPISEINKISKYLKKRKIFLIEDCSQAHGAYPRGNKTKVGNYGNIAAFSMMYRKNIAMGGSGGMVYTKNKKLHLLAMRHADRGAPVWMKYKLDLRNPGIADFPALNFNTSDLSCATGIAQIERVNTTIQNRKKFIKRIIELIKISSKVCIPYDFHNGFSPFYFPIFVKKELIKCSVDKFAKAIQAEGIGVGIKYGCLPRTWKWANKYFVGQKTKNAINTRNRCFHLYVNENYKYKEALDTINAIVKVENFYLK
jgi:perosamine synthetase